MPLITEGILMENRPRGPHPYETYYSLFDVEKEMRNYFLLSRAIEINTRNEDDLWGSNIFEHLNLYYPKTKVFTYSEDVMLEGVLILHAATNGEDNGDYQNDLTFNNLSDSYGDNYEDLISLRLCGVDLRLAEGWEDDTVELDGTLFVSDAISKYIIDIWEECSDDAFLRRLKDNSQKKTLAWLAALLLEHPDWSTDSQEHPYLVQLLALLSEKYPEFPKQYQSFMEV